MKIAVLGLMDQSHLERRAPADVELVGYRPRIAAFPHTPYDRLLVDLAHVEAAERASADRVDAILIDSTCDWGIEAIRAAVEMPVVGAGEVGIAEASAGGRPFAIVTVWPPALAFLYSERVRMVEGGVHCVGTRFASADHELDRLGADEGVVARMGRGELPVIDRLVEECRRSVREDGAEAILLGCTCMANAAPLIEERFSGAPVIEPSRSALAVAIDAAPARRNRTALGGLASEIVNAWLDPVGSTRPIAGSSTANECEACLPGSA